MKWDNEIKRELIIFIIFYWILRVGFGYSVIEAFPLALIGVVGYKITAGKKREED